MPTGGRLGFALGMALLAFTGLLSAGIDATLGWEYVLQSLGDWVVIALGAVR